MSGKAFRISGKVVDQGIGQGVPSLRVEVWDQDLIFNDLIGSVVTDQQGRFQMEFSQAYFQECFLDRPPGLFFKVYRGSQLIKRPKTQSCEMWRKERFQ